MYTFIYLTILSIIFILFSYIYIRPWLKGTYKYSKNPNCSSPGPCKKGSWCCKSPGEDDTGWCMSKKCDSIRLESPSDYQISLFTKFLIFSLLLTVMLVTIEVYLKKNRTGFITYSIIKNENIKKDF
jgi:hypothetical protein